MPVDRSRLFDLEDDCHHDEDECLEIRAIADQAVGFLRRQAWCPPIERIRLGFAIGGVVGVFLVEFSAPVEGSADVELWAVAGDLPVAYLVTDNAPCARVALETYCALMDDWVAAVRREEGLDGVFPVEAPPTAENAASLARRIAFIRTEVIPAMPRSDGDAS